MSVYGGHGEISVSADTASDIKVFSVNGAQVYAGHGTNVTIPASKGLYVVTVNGKAVKVTVF